ncbi:MAG: tetratricopeptide repeat protein, partial [Gammaproteobacteria bacterium]|nr:tetratricopeptide repeat protein [Gammaproteobacteria bacterium]
LSLGVGVSLAMPGLGDWHSNVNEQPQSSLQLAEGADSKSSKKSAVQEKKSPKRRSLKIVRVSPHQQNAILIEKILVAEIAGQRGMLTTAVRNYVEAAKISQDPEIAERAARIAVYARETGQALDAARLWVKLAPLSLDARQVLAALLVRNGMTDEALAHFEAVIADGEQDEQKGYMLITSLLSKEQDKLSALKVMEKLVAKRADSAHAHYAYSHLALLVGEYEKAEKGIARTLEIKSDWVQALMLQVNILSRQGRNGEALEKLATVVDDNEDDHSLRLFYARKLVDAKRLEDARDQFKQLIDNDDEDARGDAIYALGLLSLQLSEADDAEDYFKKLVELGKRSNEANYYLGQMAERNKDPADAIEYYSLVKFGDHLIDAQIRISVLIAKSGKVDEARKRLQSIDAKTSDVSLRIYLAEGEILRNDKQYETAIELYTEALAELPDNIELLYARALTAEKVDRLDVTVQDLQEIVERQPNNAQALNALGYTLVDRTDRLDEGVKLIERAYKLNSSDPAITDSMGWAYYRQGKLTEALRLLRKAFSLNNDGEIAAHLGEVMWVSGDKDGAREIWDAALRQTPEHKVLLDVIQRFLK